MTKILKVRTGKTPSAGWQPYNTDAGVFMQVNTADAAFSSEPNYFTSLGGIKHHWKAVGVTSIYEASKSGFKVFLRWADGSPLTPQMAEANGWHINWVGIETIEES